MGNRIPQPQDWWEKETLFIEAEARKTNYRMGSFHSYCDMQARFAEVDGYYTLAGRIKQAKREAS